MTSAVRFVQGPPPRGVFPIVERNVLARSYVRGIASAAFCVRDKQRSRSSDSFEFKASASFVKSAELYAVHALKPVDLTAKANS